MMAVVSLNAPPVSPSNRGACAAGTERPPDTVAPNPQAALLRESAHLRIPSKPEWIVPTVEYLCERAVRCGGCPEARAGGLTVALHEALTNSVVHGNLGLSSALKEQGDTAFAEALAARAADLQLAGRPVDIRTEYDGECLRWTLTDQGAGFDVAAALARAASDDPEVLLASGRGITLMRALLDEVRYELGGRRVVLTLRRGAEKRREERHPVQEVVRVAPLGPGGAVDWAAAYPAVARDLSAGGISLVQARLAAGRRVLIGLEQDGEVVYVPAEVRHCEALADGLVRLGCRFEGAGEPADAAPGDAADAITDLLSGLEVDAAPSHERRAHPRFQYTERVEIAGGPGPTVGFARNLSRGGISLLTTAALPPGRRVLALPRRGGAPLRLAAEVVRCVPLMDGVWEVGARFAGLAE